MELSDLKNTREENKALEGFLVAAQQFNEEFKEEIKKEKEEYLKKQGIYK